MDEYDKLIKARDSAKAECDRAYAIWGDAADRLKRIETQLHDIWIKRLEEAYLR